MKLLGQVMDDDHSHGEEVNPRSDRGINSPEFLQHGFIHSASWRAMMREYTQ